MARKPKLSPQAAFSAALAGWFREKGYNVGLEAAPFTGEEATARFKKLVGEVGKFMPATGMPFFISGGANSEALFEALAPFMGLADVLGSKLGEGLQSGLCVVVPVIHADALASEEIRRRFGLFLEYGESLDEFGPRLNLQAMGQCRIYPLLVYFDPAVAAAHKEALLAEAWELRAWKHVALRGIFADAAGGTVTWAEMTGVSAWSAAIGSMFGAETEAFHFDAADLAAIRAGAQD